MAQDDEDKIDIEDRAEEIRDILSSGYGNLLDKLKTISGAAADELSCFPGGDCSRAQRDYWLKLLPI